MTTMMKGFVAIFLLMVLAVGTVASAHSTQAQVSAQKAAVTSRELPEAAQRARPEAVPVPAQRRVAGAALSITELTHEVADNGEAHVSLQASGVLRNNSRTAIDLREVQVLLKDAEGKVAIPARIEVVGQSKDRLAPGEEVKLRLTYTEVPVDAGAMRMSLVTPVGGEVAIAISIEINCSYPPLRCRITITFDL
jgi:hypothetical protein